MEKTVYELAVEAIEEAKILEASYEDYNEEHMLETAELLSGVPFFLVKLAFERISV